MDSEPQLLSVGNLVEVAKTESPGKKFHEGGSAYILDPNHEDGVLVQFVGQRKMVVSPRKILGEKTLDTTSRRRSCDKVSRPSLLSIHHSSKRPLSTTTEKRAASPSMRPIWQKLSDARDWKEKDGLHRHPVLRYLKHGKKHKSSGWLRKDEALARGGIPYEEGKRKHLDPTERDLLYQLRLCTASLTGCKQSSRSFCPTKDLAHAFGVGVTVVKECLTKKESNNDSTKRKQRSDAGETIFNSDAKREKVWTAEFYHAKRQRIHFRGEALTAQEIAADFATNHIEKARSNQQSANLLTSQKRLSILLESH